MLSSLLSQNSAPSVVLPHHNKRRIISLIMCICFPASAKVLTTKGYVAIAHLKPSHVLLTVHRNNKGASYLKRTSFYTYLHFDSELVSEFLVLTCDNGFELKISEKHLLFKIENGSQTPVPAKNIFVGDSLVFVNETESKNISYPRVVQISRETVQGVFAPMSGNGTLIVNGFMASCYAEVQSHSLAHASTALLRAWYRTGKLFTPKKVVLKKKSSEPKQDVHNYAKVLMAIEKVLPITVQQA